MLDLAIALVRHPVVGSALLAAVILLVASIPFGLGRRAGVVAIVVVLAVDVLHPGGASDLVSRPLRRLRALTTYAPIPQEAAVEEPPPYPPRH